MLYCNIVSAEIIPKVFAIYQFDDAYRLIYNTKSFALFTL